FFSQTFKKPFIAFVYKVRDDNDDASFFDQVQSKGKHPVKIRFDRLVLVVEDAFDDFYALTWAFAGENDFFFLVGIRQKPYLAPFMNSCQGEHTGNFLSQIDFLPSGIPNILGSADVKQKINRLVFVFFEGFNKSAVALGRDLPFNGPDVISVLVGAQVIELQACSLKDGLVITLKVV